MTPSRPTLQEIPVVPAEDLNSLPVGLYQTARRERRIVHDIFYDESYEGECVLLARVCEKEKYDGFPVGADLITVRPDGNWIIYQWVRANSDTK